MVNGGKRYFFFCFAPMFFGEGLCWMGTRGGVGLGSTGIMFRNAKIERRPHATVLYGGSLAKWNNLCTEGKKKTA